MNAHGESQSHDQAQVIILASGMGSRSGRPTPKPLTPLASGKSIMAHQVDGIRAVFGAGARITAVVGFKKDMIMEAFPNLLYTYNERFDTSGTAHSLLRGLRVSCTGGVLWLNGDVVFDHRLLTRLWPMMRAGDSFACVKSTAVGEEQITWAGDGRGTIGTLSRNGRTGEGLVVGINYVGPSDKQLLMEALADCAAEDHVERGVQWAIDAGMRVHPIDISDFYAFEIDIETGAGKAGEEIVARPGRLGAGPRLVAPRVAVDQLAQQPGRRHD